MWQAKGSTTESKSKSFPQLEEGLEVIGLYKGLEEKPGKFGPMKTHFIETEEAIVGVKSFTQLDKRLSDVEEGTLLKVEYKGKSPEGWHRANVFIGNDEELVKKIKGIKDTKGEE